MILDGKNLAFWIKDCIEEEVSVQENLLGLPSFEVFDGRYLAECDEFLVGRSVEFGEEASQEMESLIVPHLARDLARGLLAELGKYLRTKKVWPKTIWIGSDHFEHKMKNVLTQKTNLHVECRFFFENEIEEKKERT